MFLQEIKLCLKGEDVGGNFILCSADIGHALIVEVIRYEKSGSKNEACNEKGDEIRAPSCTACIHDWLFHMFIASERRS
jgi:hypothetical protein